MIYDTINPRIVNFIFADAKPGTKILDVGCGTGKLGRILKSKINCYLAGIEIDREAANIAKDVYDEVALMDLENLLNGSYEPKNREKYNFVICGDVLEHVTNPELLLVRIGELLGKDGFLIASIPNIANWMIRIQLLLGKFDYSGGILDQGHLRFFTYRTARRLLENSGYRIISVINNNETWLFRFLGKIWMGMFAFQFVFKCAKKIDV